jgi:hypothetical protein
MFYVILKLIFINLVDSNLVRMILSQKDEMYDILFILPDHLVDMIYQIKRFMEEDEARDWHLKCPRYILNPPKWIPVNINDNWKIGNIEFQKEQIGICLKCLVEPGFILDDHMNIPPLNKKIQAINQTLIKFTPNSPEHCSQIPDYSSKRLYKQLLKYKRWKTANQGRGRPRNFLVV